MDVLEPETKYKKEINIVICIKAIIPYFRCEMLASSVLNGPRAGQLYIL
jgi:hypothetical protein